MKSSAKIEQYLHRWELDRQLNSELKRSLRLLQMQPKQELTIANGPEANLYFLVDGQASIRYGHLSGKQSSVGYVKPLALLGELDLFYTPKLGLTIVMEELSTFLYLEQTAALKFGQDDPRFLRLIIQQLSQKLTDTTFILKYNALPLLGQLASYLLTHVEEGQTPLPISSRSYLADLLGTTVRHLNRMLNQLTTEQIIAVQGHSITILNERALRQYTEL